MLAQVLLIASLPSIFCVGCATFLAYKQRPQWVLVRRPVRAGRFRRDRGASDGAALAVGWPLKGSAGQGKAGWLAQLRCHALKPVGVYLVAHGSG